ncbi:MAG: hypothetical protein RL380_1266 [Verrucomicrobiota bacterium]|jgi:predicted regulator of Ras-like GTPase activity (Roadblock/LC7/MglB family)
MFGFVKNWFGNSAAPAASSLAPVSVSPVAAPSLAPRAVADPNSLWLPLALVVGKLPADLRERVRMPNHSQLQLSLPLTLVLPQLARGAVKLSFADLRRLSPDGVFFTQTDKDNFMVELPLPEILARLKPEHLPRRGQQAMRVADEIVSPFAGRGEGLNFYKPAVVVASAPAVVEPEPEPAVAAPIKFPAHDRFVNPPSPGVRAPENFSAPLSASVAMPAFSGFRGDLPPSASATSVMVQAAAPPPNPSGATLRLALADLSGAWLPAVRSELAHFGLTDSMLAVPLAAVEDGLKKGRMIFTWKQIRAWTESPAATMSSSAHDAELLEFPLKSVAPAFLARQRQPRPAARLAVDTNIPDTFAGPARPAPSSPVVAAGNGAPPVSAPAGNVRPASPPAVEPIVFPDEESGKARLAEALPVADLPRSGTEFLKRYATPNDIVGKAASLDGVVGALVTLPDGLLVASHLPPGVNGDQLAAFMPQVFSRISQSAREFRMGELRDLSFTVGVTPWKVFRVGAIFFAVFGNDRDPLPVAKLASLAAELDRKPRP